MKWWPVLFVLAVLAAVYLLHRQGFGVSKSVAAVLFVFRPGKDADKVTLDSCSGWVSHAGRFRESRTYAFALDGRLSKGDVDVVLLDKKKQPLLKLDRQSPAAQAELDGNSRYYLRWNFKNATGKCELHW